MFVGLWFAVHRNPATCGTNQVNKKRRFAPPLRAGGETLHGVDKHPVQLVPRRGPVECGGWGLALNLRTTTSQKCEAVPRRARI